jgi:hypothetical protein
MTAAAGTRQQRSEQLARATGRFRSVSQLRADTWRAVARARAPITPASLAKRAGVTTGAAVQWLHEWATAGRLIEHPGPPENWRATTYTLPAPNAAVTNGAPPMPTDDKPDDPTQRPAADRVVYRGGPLDGQAAAGRVTAYRTSAGQTLRYRRHKDGVHITFLDTGGKPTHPQTYYRLQDRSYVITTADRAPSGVDTADTAGHPDPSPPARHDASTAPDAAPVVPVISEPFRVLVTGSRTWEHAEHVTSALEAVRADCAGQGQRLTVVHGACPRGADAIADAWAIAHHSEGVRVERHPADWDRIGRRAGFRRNSLMVAAGADLCLAFIRDESTGATHCADRAEAAGIPVHRVTATSPNRARGALGTVRRDRLIPAALAYAARGWHVFPLRPDDKRPAFPNHAADKCDGRDVRCARAGRHVTWQERATTDPARITAAWGSAPFGIGIATGPSGLLVVDLDVPKPGEDTPPEWLDKAGVCDGADVFAHLCEQAGEPVPWDTYTTHTASGGTHLYFTTPTPAAGSDALRSTTGALGWLIDTRAAGGYVVAPPSTAGGRPYTRASDADAAAAALPAWIAAALAPRPLPVQQPVTVALSRSHDVSRPGPAGSDRVDDARAAAYVAAAIREQARTVAEAAPRTRNTALYRSAVALGQLVAGGALTAEDVTAHLEPAATAAGLEPTEITRTIASGLRAGARRPRHLPDTTHAQDAA